MIKVAIIGAGSTVFAAELMRDILATPALEQGAFALVDIDARRLELAHQVAGLLVERSGKNWQVVASTERKQVLAGSQYVINTIDVAGLENVRHDYDIPLKYGVDQCIGDTIGPGGLFKALRTLPEWLAILEDVERLAPGGLVMNYTNPMSISVLAGIRASNLPIVGLCHSVQHTSAQLAVYLDVSYPELSFRLAGINHMAWFVELSRNGEDLYPELRRQAGIPEIYEQDPARFEVMLELGVFVTESSGHFSEYVPYFRKRPDLMAKYMRPGYRGESGYYANNWPAWRERGERKMRRVIAGEEAYTSHRGTEYASYIIEAIQTGQPAVIYGNVSNTGLIDNLPTNGVVEVACLVDDRGLQPTHFGALPPVLAALNAQHMAFHDLAVTAVLEKEREAAVHALMLDPLSSAVCSLSEIRQMFDEMCRAQADYLPDYLTNW
jgi:alpha-galactosidase